MARRRPGHRRRSGADRERGEINPARLPAQYEDLTVRDAVLAAASLAVADTARDVAHTLAGMPPQARGERDADWRAQLRAGAEHYTDGVRAWITQPDPRAERDLDPRLAAVLHGFVHRLDRSAVRALTTAAGEQGVDPAELGEHYTAPRSRPRSRRTEPGPRARPQTLRQLGPATPGTGFGQEEAGPRPDETLGVERQPSCDGLAELREVAQRDREARQAREAQRNRPDPTAETGTQPAGKRRHPTAEFEREAALDDELAAHRRGQQPPHARREPEISPEIE